MRIIASCAARRSLSSPRRHSFPAARALSAGRFPPKAAPAVTFFRRIVLATPALPALPSGSILTANFLLCCSPIASIPRAIIKKWLRCVRPFMTRSWSRWVLPSLLTLLAKIYGALCLSRRFFVFDLRQDESLGRKNSLLQITCSLLKVRRLAQVAPIIVIRTKRDNFFSAASQAQISIDDGENTFFHH